jgi:hypothetical protein
MIYLCLVPFFLLLLNLPLEQNLDSPFLWSNSFLFTKYFVYFTFSLFSIDFKHKYDNIKYMDRKPSTWSFEGRIKRKIGSLHGLKMTKVGT